MNETFRLILKEDKYFTLQTKKKKIKSRKFNFRSFVLFVCLTEIVVNYLWEKENLRLSKTN